MKAALSLFVWTFMFAPVSSARGVQTQPVLSDTQRWTAEHEAGRKALDQGRYSEAIRSFETAIGQAERFGSTDPRLAQSSGGAAQAYLLQGNLAAAERRFRQALAVFEKTVGPNDPNVAMALNGLATVHRLRENHEEAAAMARRSLTILEKAYGAEHPNVAVAQNNLAMILRLKGDYEEARLLSERSLSILEKALGPEHVNVAVSLNNLVLAHLLAGNEAAAEPFARRSLSILEKTPEAGLSNLAQSLENLADVCLALGKYDESEGLYRRVLSVRWGGGTDISPLLDRFADMVNLAFFGKPLQEAQEAFQAAPGWTGISADLYVRMGRALRDRALTAEPEALMLRAVEAFPDSPEVRYELAQVYAETHRYQAAVETLRNAANAPASGDAALDRYRRALIHEEIARMHGLLFQFDEALSNLKAALEIDPGNARTLVALGDLYLRLDMPEEAAAQYAQAILLTGGAAAAYYGIAEANRRLGRYPQAVIAADRALEIDPRDAKSSYVRSLALLRDGRAQEGEIELERFRRLEADDHREGVRVRAIPVTLHTALVRFEDGQTEAALDALYEGVRSYPDSVSLHLNLGILQSRLGRHRDAVQTFQSMIDRGLRNRDYFLVHLNLSREYEILGDTNAGRFHRLMYLQEYDAFLENKLR